MAPHDHQVVLGRLGQDDLGGPPLEEMGLKGYPQPFCQLGGPVQGGQALPAQIFHQGMVVGKGFWAQEEPRAQGLQDMEEGHPGPQGLGQAEAFRHAPFRCLAAVGG